MGSLFKLNENDNNAEVVAKSNVGSGTLYRLAGAGVQEAPRPFQTAAQQTANIRANEQAAAKTGAPVLGATGVNRREVAKSSRGVQQGHTIVKQTQNRFGGGAGRGSMTQEEAAAGVKAAKEHKIEDFSAAKLAGGIATKGVDSAMSGLTSTAEWLVGQNITGLGNALGQDWSNNPVSALNRQVQKAKQTNQDYFQPNVERGGRAAEIADKYGTATMAAVPQALAAIATAGSSAAAETGAAGLQAASTAAQSGGALFKTIVQKLAKDPQYWLAFSQVAGDSYQQAKADGASDAAANLYAMANGLGNAAIEVGGGIQTLPKELQKTGRALKAWAESAVEEGKEEVTQGILERGLQNLIYQKKNPLASVTDGNAVLNPRTAAEEFAGGAVVGGILGGGQTLLNRAVNPQKSYVELTKDGVKLAGEQKNTATILETVRQKGNVQEPPFEEVVKHIRGSELPNAMQDELLRANALARNLTVENARNYISGTLDEKTVMRGISEAANMRPVANVAGTEFAKGEKDLTTQVTEYFDSVGGVAFNPQLGDVQLTRSGAKSDIAHGIGRKKAAAFAAVPQVIENGRVIDYQTNWKDRQYDTAVVAAPITIGEESYLAGIVLTRNQRENNFYVHEVLLTEKGTTPFKTGGRLNGDVPGGDVPSVISLLRKVQNVKDIKTEPSARTSAPGNPTVQPVHAIDGSAVKSPDAASDGSGVSPESTVADTELSKKNSQDTVFNTDVSTSPEHNARSVPPQSSSMNNIAQGDGKSNGKTGGNFTESTENGTKETETQTWDIMPKLDGGANQERENAGYLDALADDKNAPKAQQENRPTMARKDLRTNVLNLFSVPAGNRKALGEAIDRAGAEMLRTGGVTEENRSKLMDALYDAGVTVRDADPAYKAVRDDLKGRKIYVDESTMADLGDDWRGLAGRALGNGFSLTTDAQKGTSVDRIMQEMAGKFGEGMFDETLDSSTALRELMDIAEAGKPEHIGLQEEAEDFGRQYGEGAVEDHADNLRRQMDAALQRFAEKAGLEIKLKNRSDAAVAKEREHWKELLQRSNDRGRERLENQKTYYQDMMQRKKERHERSVAATQTQKSLRYLRRRLGYHDTKLAEALDSMSAEDRETAEHALQNIADNAKSLTAEANEKLKANAERYRALVENDKNYIPDKETLEMLERMDREYLADKSVEELATIHRVVQTLRTHLADMDREIGREHGRQIETIYQQSKAEIQGSKGHKPASKARRKTAEFTDSQLTPMNRLKQLGGWKDGALYSMAEQLEAGERARKDFEVKANRLLKDFQEKNADWIAKSDGQGKDATWYELEVPELLEWGKGDKPIFGDTVKVSLTPAMRVELARGVRNYDNQRHAEGGVTFPDRTLYSKGERAEAYARGTTIKLAPETMKKLFSYENLTPEEQELYRLGDQFFNQMAKDAINKTSQEMDGVDRAMSQNYSKIYTNASYRPTDVTTVDQSLGGMGSLQKRVQSKAPMLAVSMWEAYADTIDTVSKYSGLAIPVRNMNMLYNWMESGQNESLKSVLEKKWGTGSTKFMENLLKELQNKQVLDKSGVDALADYLLKNYVTATFGANPGIVLKQATSFPSGAAVLGWDTIPTPRQMSKVDTELIAKYTPELEYRSMGYATPELAELKNNPNWTQRNKFTRFVFGGAIQAMDRATVKCMWPWAENAVRKNYTDLEPGSDAFYKKTAELFNKAVSETQPMYDVMHRAEIMQNPSALTRTFTMFKTVPLQQQNMIRRAIGEAREATTPAEVSKARGQVASTAASLVVATLGYEGVEFFNQMLKNAAKGYRDDDDDDKLTTKSVLTTLAENSVKDLAGMAIGGKDLADVLMKSFGDVDFYETAAPGLSQIMDLKATAEQTMETFKTVLSDTKDLRENGGSLKQYVKENGNDLLGNVKDTATLLAELSKGVPVPNIEKYLLWTLQWTSPELREEYKTLWDSTNKRDLNGLSSKALRVRVGKLMDLRVDNLSNQAKDELARLYESVGTEVIPADVPGKIHMDDDEDASLTRTMRQTYQNAYGKALTGNLEKLLTSKPYQSMTDPAKSAAVTDLYDYAKAVAADKTVGKEMTSGAQKAAGVIADGGELPDYLHFCATVGERNAAERLKYLSRGEYSEASKTAIYLNALASDSKQKAWAELKQQGITKEEFYRYALAVNGQTAKGDLLRAMEGLSLSDDKKATLYFAVEASDSEKEKLDAAEKEGVSEQVYFQYLAASAGMSKKAEKLEAINSLDLTVNQKNALYDANGWAKSTLYDAPWYDIMPRLSSGSSGRTSNGRTSRVKTGTALDKYGLGKYDIMPKLR